MYGQKIENLSVYVKPNGETRYVVSLTNNSIWWTEPNIGQWTKVLNTGLFDGLEIKNLSAYIKPNEESRYVISLANNTIWWADPNIGKWTKVSAPK